MLYVYTLKLFNSINKFLTFQSRLAFLQNTNPTFPINSPLLNLFGNSNLYFKYICKLS